MSVDFLMGAGRVRRMKARAIRPARIGLAVLIAVGGAGGAQAQSEQELSLIEEIIVTASKRGAVSVQDIPMSVRAVSAETLARKDVEDFVDWARLIPGLITEDQGPGEKRIVIRGIRAEGPATVGVYWDEAVITGSNTEDDGGGRNADIRLYDMERIEVLRGPQGTLYGANSFSGTIRYIPAKPDPERVAAGAEAEFATTRFGDESYKLNGFVNLPIAEDSLAVRAVAYYEDEGGFIDNVRLGIEDENDQETYGGRVALRLAASERLTLDGSVVVQRTDLGGKQRFFPDVGDLQTDLFILDRFEDDLELYQLTGNYETGVGQVTATTAFFDRDVFFRFDSTPILLFFGVPLPAAIAVVDQPDKRENWSNEIRFASDFGGRFEFVVGGFYERQEKDFASNVISATVDGVPTGTEADIFGRVSSFTVNQYALFGEASFDITDQLNFLAGIRWFDFNQDSQSRETVPFFDPGNVPPPDPDRSASESDINLKFALSYQPNEDLLLYGLASEGFRQGGTNSTGFGNLIIIPEEFESDSIWNYEIGAKTSFADDRLVFNISGYLIDWSNIQVEQQEPVQGFSFIGNAGEARVIGLEAELYAYPVPALELVLAAGYQNAELTEDQPPLDVGTEVGRDGDPIPFVPDFTFAASAEYSVPVFEDWEGYIRGDLSYTDDSVTQFNDNVDFFNRQESYTIVDLRVGIESDNWKLALFAENLFDERAELTIIETIAVPRSVFTNRPRTFGVTLGARF